MSLKPAAALAVTLGLLAGAAEFKVYPGSRSEPWLEEYRKEANALLKTISEDQPEAQMWITSDSYDRVRAFYRKLGSEDAEFGDWIARTQSDSSGRRVRATYVLFDGASEAISSTNYAMIQRPVVLQYHPLKVRDVTLIALYRKK